MYSLSLKLNGETTESKGETVLEAIKGLTVPMKISSKGVVTLTQDDRRVERVMMPIALRRFFYPQFQTYAADNLESGLK